jgi:hypothetical protein
MVYIRLSYPLKTLHISFDAKQILMKIAFFSSKYEPFFVLKFQHLYFIKYFETFGIDFSGARLVSYTPNYFFFFFCVLIIYLVVLI